MTTSFSIDYEWLTNDYGDAAERSTLAELAINFDDLCATKVEDVLAKSVRSTARLSALHLAEWLAANWWRLLWEPRADTYSWKASHKVGNAGRGYVWPDLSFSSDWQSVLVSARPTSRWDAEPIRYLNQFDTAIPISDYERGVDNFIEGTIARLFDTGNPQSDLNELWKEVGKERRDPDVAAWRRLEACMGYDPDDAPPELINGLRKQAEAYGANAIQEVAAASKEQAISHIGDLWKSAQKNDVSVYVPHCADIRQLMKTESGLSAIPWRRATQVAQIAREVWGLEVPVHTKRLSELLDIPESQFSERLPGERQPLIAGFRDGDTLDTFRISWNSNHPTSRRFALARLVADHIAAHEEERLLPGTNLATNRQKFQRAFAQELLCPVDALKEHLGVGVPSNDYINDAAEYFDVSTLTVQNVLVNKGIVDRESLEEWVA